MREAMSKINIYNQDCMIAMTKMKDKEFDLAIVDVPYFSGPERRTFFGSKVSSIGVHRVYKKSSVWQLATKEYFSELLRVSKYYVFWGTNYYNFNFHSGRIVWDKVNSSSDYSDCELAATNLFDHTRLFRFMWNGMLQGKNISEVHIMQGNKKLNEKRIHPTQKPVFLYQWILGNYAKPGWKCLDTHGGSMSSAIAFDREGFDADIYEIDKDYYQAGLDRFNLHKQQQVLAL
jgi:site-specific DNA-methyltransferase (adenine-specific)